ncbi:hypothetical protein PhCBS80983_g03637 [Powellomyces hirtus]|uniref:ASTRA-associated protein 1 n=1 Tax=Powellomyces hirtus TaxID=109895 RepID=A0A507E3Q0_9FUNG|nr:hypothetical protein PhCBS80983_g03637 [Powellomyces hirtus]
MTTRRPLRRWKAHESGILALHGLSADQLLRGDQLHIWSLAGEQEEEPGPQFTLLVNSLNFCGVAVLSTAGEAEQSEVLLALPAIDENAAIDVYNLSTRKYERQGIMVPNATKDTGLCMCLKFFKGVDQRIYLAAGYESGTVIVWDVEKGTLVQRCKIHDEPVLSLDISPDGRSGFCGGAYSKVVQFAVDIGTESDLLRISSEQTLPARGTAVARVRPDSKIVAIGSWDSSIRIYKTKALKPLAVLQAHRQGIQCLCFASGTANDAESEGNPTTPANTFAAGSKDGTITLWQIY